MKKILLIALSLIMLFVCDVSYASTVPSIGAQSSTPTYLSGTFSRDYTSWSLTAGQIIAQTGTATSLTVRPYSTTGERLSNARTFHAGALSGSQAYWSNGLLLSTILIKTNHNGSGMITIGGIWRF